MVPCVRNAQALDFQEFMTAFDDIVARARTARLTPGDFQGTTISLTNPGTVGTVQSVPRLMPGQGAIVATGSIDYPAGYQGSSPETRAAIAISKVMTMTCTYDHRIIQGAESGLFLGKIQALLEGQDGFLRPHLCRPEGALPRGPLGTRSPVDDCGRRTIRRDRQRGGGPPVDQRIPGARAPDRGPRPAGA